MYLPSFKNILIIRAGYEIKKKTRSSNDLDTPFGASGPSWSFVWPMIVGDHESVRRTCCRGKLGLWGTDRGYRCAAMHYYMYSFCARPDSNKCTRNSRERQSCHHLNLMSECILSDHCGHITNVILAQCVPKYDYVIIILTQWVCQNELDCVDHVLTRPPFLYSLSPHDHAVTRPPFLYSLSPHCQRVWYSESTSLISKVPQ